MNTLETLLIPVFKDSFGGIMYDVANRGKYDSTAILSAWDSLSNQERSASGGLITGAIRFLKSN